MFTGMEKAEHITMTQTGLIQGKTGKVIHITFERKTENGQDYADFIMPGRKALKSKGFDEGELAQFQFYLKGHEKEIIQQAKQITHDMLFKL